MMFKMSLLLDKIQQVYDIEIWYNIMKFNMSLLLDKIQQARDVEIWYNIPHFATNTITRKQNHG